MDLIPETVLYKGGESMAQAEVTVPYVSLFSWKLLIYLSLWTFGEKA